VREALPDEPDLPLEALVAADPLSAPCAADLALEALPVPPDLPPVVLPPEDFALEDFALEDLALEDLLADGLDADALAPDALPAADLAAPPAADFERELALFALLAPSLRDPPLEESRSPPSPPPVKIPRKASATAVTTAAPILLALSAAASTPSIASLVACLAPLRTFWLAVSAAAAVTRPAAIRLRATGLLASSTAFCPRSPMPAPSLARCSRGRYRFHHRRRLWNPCRMILQP
jgi:hypothetical protein